MGSFQRERGWLAKDLSVDCKPDLPEEKERIVRAGGVVSPASMGRPSRVWANGRIGLAMSRSLGDGECKRFGVIAEPRIEEFEVKPAKGEGETEGDHFLVVASDGVWEFIESQEAVEIVAEYNQAKQVSPYIKTSPIYPLPHKSTHSAPLQHLSPA